MPETTLNLEKLRKVAAMMDSPAEGERAAAMERTRAMLSAAGKSFRDLPDLLGSKPAPATTRTPSSAGDGDGEVFTFDFGEAMEAKHPGWKAERAREQVEKACKRAAYLKSVIAKYGTKKAAQADDERQRAVERAAAPMLRKVMKKYGNGTFETMTLDGWSGFIMDGPVPEHVAAAIKSALPFPRTIPEAKREYDYWRERSAELEVLYGDMLRDEYLSLACGVRHDLVRKALETELRAASLDDVRIRQRHLVDSEWSDEKIEAAVMADLDHLAGQPPSQATPVQNGHLPTASARRAEVIRLLSTLDTKDLSDREIARRVGVSPQTVGNLRRRITVAVP